MRIKIVHPDWGSSKAYWIAEVESVEYDSAQRTLKFYIDSWHQQYVVLIDRLPIETGKDLVDDILKTGYLDLSLCPIDYVFPTQYSQNQPCRVHLQYVEF